MIAPGDFGEFFDQVVMELQARGLEDPKEVGDTIARIGREWNVDLHPERVPVDAQRFLPR